LHCKHSTKNAFLSDPASRSLNWGKQPWKDDHQNDGLQFQIDDLSHLKYPESPVRSIVWTYGHFASRIPVLYVFCRLLKNTSKIRPFFKFEGRGSVFCPKAAKSSNLKTYYGAHLCEDLIDLSGTQILVLVVSNQAFAKFKAQILSALKKAWRTFAVFPFSLSKILKNTWFLTPLKNTRIPYVQTMVRSSLTQL
jgi:hypothetical protein